MVISSEHRLQKQRQKSIAPQERLIQYMKEKSEISFRKRKLELRQEKLQSKTKRSNTEEADLSKISDSLHKLEGQLIRLKNTKVKLLDEIVFPSLANLTFFFEAIAESQILQETFESDITELLGIRRNDPTSENYAFMFNRLITSVLFTTTENKNDFRLRLVNHLEKICLNKLRFSISKISETRGPLFILQDIERAVAWSEMIASGIKDEYNFDIQFDEEFGDTKKRIRTFHEEARKNAPHRTFEFLTHKLISSF